MTGAAEWVSKFIFWVIFLIIWILNLGYLYKACVETYLLKTLLDYLRAATPTPPTVFF